MKSRSSMISRFSAIGLAELFDGIGRVAALASAPARTSSKVIGGGSVAGCRWMVPSRTDRSCARTRTNPIRVSNAHILCRPTYPAHELSRRGEAQLAEIPRQAYDNALQRQRTNRYLVHTTELSKDHTN